MVILVQYEWCSLLCRFSLLRPPFIIWPHFSHFDLVPLATLAYAYVLYDIYSFLFLLLCVSNVQIFSWSIYYSNRGWTHKSGSKGQDKSIPGTELLDIPRSPFDSSVTIFTLLLSKSIEYAIQLITAFSAT